MRNTRANALADRLENGASALASLASTLSDSEWQARLPKDGEARGIQNELRVLEGASPWLAIWQHAGRANADLICMSTHSKDAVTSLVLGSQAQALLQHSRIPVVLVPPDRES